MEKYLGQMTTKTKGNKENKEGQDKQRTNDRTKAKIQNEGQETERRPRGRQRVKLKARTVDRKALLNQTRTA